MTGKSNVPTASMLKSMIIVTAPTGSTVTCTNGSITKTAIERNGTWTFRGILTGTWTVKGTKSGQSTSKTVTITRLEVEYVTLTYRVTPEFTYTGSYKILTDSDGTISDFASYKGNWKIKFLTSGTFKIVSMHGFTGGINVFLVGGGGGGGASGTEGEGITTKGGTGGPGYNKTVTVTPSVGTNYTITIGAGGRGGPYNASNSNGGGGGTTSAFGNSVSGGKGATATYWGAPGTDGSGGTAAYEFNWSSGNRYSVKAGSATDNTGNSGAGGYYSSGTHQDGKAGRSGVVIIRNKR